MKHPNQKDRRRDDRPLILIVSAAAAVVAATVIPLDVWLTGVMALALAVVCGLFGLGLCVVLLDAFGVTRSSAPSTRECSPTCGPHTGRTIPRQQNRRSLA